jgi:hypothetical protein
LPVKGIMFFEKKIGKVNYSLSLMFVNFVINLN